MFVFRARGDPSSPFLPQVVPTLLRVARRCETELRVSLFQHLGVLIRLKHRIRGYLGRIFRARRLLARPALRTLDNAERMSRVRRSCT